MEINKQLFEDVLSDKLKGKFVLRNGDTYSSVYLYRNYNKFRFTHPYMIGFGSYTPKGLFPIYGGSKLDIVDFIPDTDMKENDLTIEIPKGYEIDKENSTFEKIVFKKKDSKPRSWEEYVEQQAINNKEGYYLSPINCHIYKTYWCKPLDTGFWKNVLPSKELAEAFRAMMQLMSLRHDWIHKWSIDNGMTNDWKPDWSNSKQDKWGIKWVYNTINAFRYIEVAQTLSFPTKEMATDFMNCFKDLLNTARPLI